MAFLSEPASAGKRRLLFPSDGNTYRTIGPNLTHTGQPDPPGIVLGSGPNGTCKPLLQADPLRSFPSVP